MVKKFFVILLVLVILSSHAFAVKYNPNKPETLREGFVEVLRDSSGNKLEFGNTSHSSSDFFINNIPKKPNKGDTSSKADGNVTIEKIVNGFTGGEFVFKISNFKPEKFGAAVVPVPTLTNFEIKEFNVEYGIRELVPYQSAVYELIDTGDYTYYNKTFETKFRAEVVYGKTAKQVKNKTGYIRITAKWNPTFSEDVVDVLIKYGSWRKEFAWWSSSATTRHEISIGGSHDAYDENVTIFSRNLDLTATSCTDVEQLILVQDDGNNVLDRWFEGDCSSTDANMMWRFQTSVGSDTDVNGDYFLYVNDVNFDNVNGVRLTDWNAIFLDASSSFDTNNMEDYDTANSHTWHSEGYVSTISSIFTGGLQYNLGQTPSNLVAILRGSHALATSSDHICVNTNDPTASRGHCLGGEGGAGDFIRAAEPNVADLTSSGTSGVANEYFTMQLTEFSDSNAFIVATNTDADGFSNPQTVKISEYREKAWAVAETGFTDYDNTEVEFSFNTINVGADTNTDFATFFYWLAEEGTSFLGPSQGNDGVVDLNLVSLDGNPFGQGMPVFSFLVDGNLTIDFNLTHDLNNFVFDINYSTSSTEGTGTVLYNDLNFNANPEFCENQNFNVSTRCSIDFDIENVADANYFILAKIIAGTTTDFNADPNHSFMINNVSNVKVTFYNEDTNGLFDPDFLTVDGNVFSTTAGVFDFNISTSKKYTIVASHTGGIHERTFVFELDADVDHDFNLTMLDSNRGNTITFKFYDIDKTTLLTNKLVFIPLEDKNAVTKFTDGVGEVTFFLNPQDANYIFRIDKNSDTQLTYYQTVVTIRTPKNERDGVDLVQAGDSNTFFDLKVTGLKQQDFLEIGVDQNFTMFSNTKNFYLATVDQNTDFFSRSFALKTLGDTNTLIIQPYLVNIPDGVSTTVRVLNSLTLVPIQDAKIDLYRFIAGQGRVLIESIISDNKGESFISGITNEQYEFELYYNNTLIHTFPEKVTSTTLNVLFNPNLKTINAVNRSIANIVFTPSFGSLTAQSPLQDLNQYVDWNLSVGVTVTDINIGAYDTNGNVEIYKLIFINPTLPFFNLINVDGNLSGWDRNFPVRIDVNVGFSDGNISRLSATYFDLNASSVAYLNTAWINTTTGFRELLGCSANPDELCPGTTILALIVILGLLGTFLKFNQFQTAGTSIPLFIAFLGFFTYLSWIPLFLWIISTLFGVVYYWGRMQGADSRG
ncbi:MAG: hypothetical protein CL528_13405 [Aequorivita sp.]|nr:hypothetical protein [Aequorivita sp.]|tara:strand:- start:5890 stop:9537 length:3648 start_codon:yes stop_codon:yes gene_type:complete